MRRVALNPRPRSEIRRVILYQSDDGVYLFLSKTEDDAGSFADEWYASVDDAEAESEERFGITEDMWVEVPDPRPGCQADWIAPVRVRGRESGKPEWGVLERLVNDEWMLMNQEIPK